MTHETKHTPGPWRVSPRTTHVLAGDTFICDAMARQDAIGGMQVSECAANARLIASAPDLLTQRDALAAALRGCLPAIRWAIADTEVNGDETTFAAALDAARAALALVERGQS